MNAAFTQPFQAMFKPCRYQSVELVNGRGRPTRGYQ